MSNKWNENGERECEMNGYVERDIINPLHMFKLCVQCMHSMRYAIVGYKYHASEWVNDWGTPNKIP